MKRPFALNRAGLLGIAAAFAVAAPAAEPKGGGLLEFFRSRLPRDAAKPSDVTPSEARAVAKEAYIYGFPMVDGYRIQYAYYVDRNNPEFKAPWNEIRNMPRVFTHEDKAVQTPNSDTPYSMAGLDLRTEPIVLTVPPIEKSRYFSVQLIDLYTHNFAYLGSRATGNNGGSFLLAGPNWNGAKPSGVNEVIRVETDLALAVYRTQLFNPGDLDNVKKVQAGYQVQPLSEFLGKPAPPSAPTIEFLKPLTPEQQKTSPEFFNLLNFVLQFCPAHSSEKALMARFASLGIGAGKTFDAGKLAPELRKAVEDGMADAWQELDEFKQTKLDTGKVTSGDMFGTREYLKNNYLYRMAAAVLGIYGNSKAEAMYPVYSLDAAGEKLDASKNRYVLRFAPGQLPPAHAFWSLTMYEMPASLLVANPLNRYFINSPMLSELKRDADGGLTLFVQHNSPGKETESNWLPAPSGPFMAVLRIYWPKDEAINGTWNQPPLTQTAAAAEQTGAVPQNSASISEAESGGTAPAVPSSGSDVLPFPPTPSASIAGLTMKDSVHKKRVTPSRLQPGAPNVLIILIDDVGPGVASTYGGEINTPTLDRVAKSGISFNRFHSTAMCSPTRAALLTGRNHTRVGNGQICEMANDWDGFSGTIPKSSACVAEVLKDYGYNTGAWGKWHNTPAEQTTSKGPFDYWPAGYGFEYFYGFLAGEASQYEPRLVKNTTIVEHSPKTSGGHSYYHLTEDLADNAIHWLREQQAFSPDKPFFMYWATGASHGPHHITREWADKYKGKFDDGWDKYRERVFANAKAKGWIPQSAQLTPRPATLPAWESIPEDQQPFQRRLMEIWAGFTEHADYNAGRVLDEIEKEGKLDNTLVFYIMGDNGNSAEGQNGTISELLAQNGIPTTIDQHIKALNELGGLDVLGSPKTDNHYNAAWAWAGSSPYKSTKLVAAHFGGTRQNMAVSWPARIKHDDTPRSQFHHVTDVVPTIYEAAKITPPRVVNAFEQTAMDGISMVYTFADAKAKDRKKTQFFDVMGSRGIYNDGWFACTFGPRTPWIPGLPPGIGTWNPENDVWELYNLNEDWSQANDLAAKMPEKVALMKSLFLVESAKNLNLPIGGGLRTPIFHPEDAPATPYTEWTFQGPITGMPEFTAPKLGKFNNTVSVDLDVPANANGVVYALGGFSAGLACFVKDGVLNYEYNLFEIQRTKIQAKDKLPVGKVHIDVESKFAAPKPGAPLKVTLKVDGKTVAEGTVPLSAPFGFTAQDCLDIGSDLGSPVSLDYFDAAPFKFNGTIGTTKIAYPKK